MDTFRGKVLYKKNWGRFIKAEQQNPEPLIDPRARACTLLAQLSGETVKLEHAERRHKAACSQLQAHHHKAAEKLGGAIRDFPGQRTYRRLSGPHQRTPEGAAITGCLDMFCGSRKPS